MTTARLRLAVAGETMFPPRAPSSRERGEPPGSPHPSTVMRQEPHDASRGSRAPRRAGSRPLLRLAASQGALVAAGRRSRRWCGRRGRARPRERLGMERGDDRLPRPAVRTARRRADPEPRDESADGGRDHPLRGRDPACVTRQRNSGVAAPLVDLDQGARRGRADARNQPAVRDRRQGVREAEGRARRRRTRGSRHRPRLGLCHREDRAAREPGRGVRGTARGRRGADRRGAGAAGRARDRTSRSRPSSGSC